jgi:TolB-like protein/Tfp pilus assembly protein PilF/predicted Ser/Thr protein kinase
MPLERERIGHYKVVKLAGEGGMGEVYVADDEHLPRRVAIKVISSAGASDSDVRRRFLREAHAAAALTHPNVAHIYDVGSDDGIDYIAMEYIEGETLAARLVRSAMPIDEIVTVALQIADALAAAHERGVVHRDIKPSNVMLTTRGQVKVLDFGLATADSAVVSDDTRTDASATTPGMIIGTVNYMSPEQALGEPVTSSSDVFSVGVVLYEMLAGRKPFAGKTKADTLHRLTTREPDPLARYNYDLPVELERIVRKCMEKSASLRYRSARELLVDLEALARDRSGSMAGRAPRWAEGSRRWSAKRVTIALLVLAAIVAIAALVGRAFRPAGFAREVHSVAVLPFRGASGDLEYLSDGLADSLINSLGADRDTRVMARSTVFHYKDSPLTPQKIGHDLNVDAVVIVEMQRRGDVLSLAAELVSVDDGARLWGQRYERKFAEARGIEEDLASGVRGALRMDHTAAQAAADPRRDEAHLIYLRGESEMNQRTSASMAAAVADFRRAIETDPGYAPPYAAAADTITLSARYAEMPAERLALARGYARRALQLDPSLPEAHVAMASVFDTCDWNWAAAEQEYLKAIDMRPSGVLAHQWYALLLTRLGRRDEALREIGLALKLDPLSSHVHLAAANIDYYGHSFETAAAYCAKSMEFDSVFPMTHVQMALIRIQQHRCAEARPELARGGPSLAAVATRAALEACEGNTSAAEAALGELAKRGADYEQAVAAAALQRNDLALEMLKRGIDRRNVYAGYANVDPLLDSLHADARFSALMRAAGVVR